MSRRSSDGDLAEWTAVALGSVSDAEDEHRKTAYMTYVLTCAQCSTVSLGAASGWRALLTDDEYEPKTVATFCLVCAEREFGQRRLWIRSDDE